MKTTRIALVALMAMNLAVSAAPRLVVSKPSLTPETDIDLVLDFPVVEPADLGKTVDNTWLEITPPLPAKLQWKAQNIASVIPSQAPALGATYRFAIQKGRAHLDGSPVPPGNFATLESEKFQVVNHATPNRWSSDYAPSTAEWRLYFNDGVDPAAAASFVSFSSRDGKRVAARLEQGKSADSPSYGISQTWEQRAHKEPAAEIPAGSPIPTVLVATPDSPLPVGEGWVISILKGLPNAKGNARLASDVSFEIGTIQPFRVENINGVVAPDQPREIRVGFNQALPKVLPERFLQTCVSVEPPPADLTASAEGNTLILSGNFSAQDNYQVEINRPITSRSGLPLAASFSAGVVFKPLEPTLILQSDNQAQLAGGNRIYRISAVNLASIRVRVKKLEGSNLIRAYQGYRHYTGLGADGKPITPTAPLPYSLVAGESVFEREFPLDNAIDTSKEVTLDWDEILPKALRTAGLFIDVSGSARPDTKHPGGRAAQALLQLTDIGLAWKLTTKEALVYAFSCDTGAPMPGVKIELFGEDAASLQSATTDAAGLATVPRSEAARHLLASKAADGYLTAFDSTLSTVGLWHFPIRHSWTKPLESSRQAFLFTDRSLYRPGETVRLKGIVRTRRGNAVEPEVPGTARIVIVDPQDKEIHSSPVVMSDRGSFDLAYTLPAGKTGHHSIRLEYPDELAELETTGDDWQQQEAIAENARFQLPLRVEEFRRNAFELTQNIAVPAPGAKSVSVELSAKYYQGQPVAAGKASHYTNITQSNPYPERFRDFLFGDHRSDDWSYWYHYFGHRQDEGRSNIQSSQLQGKATLSPDGSATFAIEIPQDDFPRARKVRVSTEVTDANNQTLTTSGSTTVHPASVYVGVSRVDRLVRAGEEVALKLVATDTEGQPFPSAVKVTATLTREVNSTVKTRMDSGATATRNDLTEEVLSTTEITLEPGASAAQGTDFKITPPSNGNHFLTLRGIDPEGRPFATVSHFNVYGTNEYPWLYEDGLRVKLVAEKKSYKPGETARVLVLSPIEGTALVTVEREKVLRSFQVELKANNPVVEIPLGPDDAPNAFVSILIIKGAKDSARDHKEPQLRLGYCELTVENERDRLAIGFEGDTDSYRPGDEVSLSGAVTINGGQPAAGAEVTLYAEDEGTLAVMGYETPRPMDFFYKPRMLDVEAGTSFETFISEDLESRSFFNKGFFVGGGGEMESFVDLLRKNFDPCATWAPTIITGQDGKFTHRFRLPDSLTRYRLIAIAHHGAAKFGTAESSILVKKDIMLEPKAPRFANQGDSFAPQVLVQNASEHECTLEVTYNAHAATGTPVCRSVGAVTETITLAPGTSQTAIFPTLAENTGEAVLTWKATPVSIARGDLTPTLARRLSDSVETRFQVNYPMPLLRQSKLVRTGGPNSKLDLRDHLDPRLLEGSGTIDIELSRSLLAEAAGSIDYLLSYPYGCVEQTTSSLIPWLAVEDLRSVIPAFAKVPPRKVTAAIQHGADRLLSMQLPNGSFSYWPGDSNSVDWATPYAGLGLVLASQKGANVPKSALDSLSGYLIGTLRGIGEEKSPTALETHARSLLVLALAGQAQHSYQNLLAERIDHLTAGARSLLAAAMANPTGGDPAAARAILTSKSPLKGQDDEWMRWSPDHAYRLIAWLAIDPSGTEAAEAFDRMLNDRNPYGHWRTTWVNGWSLIAISKYARTEAARADSVAVVLETAEGPQSINLTSSEPVATRSFELGPNLKLDLSASQNVFARLKVAAKPRIAPIQPVAKNGLSVDRIYEKMNGDGSASILTEPSVGDLIRVTLRVTLPGDDTRYLVIEDPLPALFETVNSDFESQQSGAGIHTSGTDWNVSHSELRSDRAVFFLDHVYRRGTYTVTYLARCTVAGEATAPPAKVESMYDPENFALSASRVFTTE